MGQGYVAFLPVGVDAPRGLGRQAQQRLDGGRSLGARLELQHLAEQRERDDHGRSFKVHRHAPHGLERRRKNTRSHGGYQAVDEGSACAQTDQRPHVGAAIHHRLGATHEEGPTSPQHDGNGQDQLDPALGGHLKPLQAVSRHGQDRDYDGQGQCPPETVTKIHQLGVLAFLQRRKHRLQAHAALGTVSWVVLLHFRVHGAGVDRARLGGFGLGRSQCVAPGHVLLGSIDEFGPALGAAKVEVMPFMLR